MKQFLTLFLLLIPSACVTDIAMQAAKTAAGGYASFYLVNDREAMPYYDSVLFTPLQNMIGNQLPSQTLQTINQGISVALKEGNFRTQGANPIYIDGFVIHADDSLLSKDIVVRVRIMNPQSWSVMREANIVAKAEGMSSLQSAAEAIGSGLTKLLDATPGAIPRQAAMPQPQMMPAAPENAMPVAYPPQSGYAPYTDSNKVAAPSDDSGDTSIPF
jgi:hypothetical protein